MQRMVNSYIPLGYHASAKQSVQMENPASNITKRVLVIMNAVYLLQIPTKRIDGMIGIYGMQFCKHISVCWP